MKTKHVVAAAFLAALSGITSAAQSAQEAKLLAELQKTYPQTKFTSATESDVPGVFEVWMGSNVAFVSPKNPRYFIFGRVVDTSTMTDLTGPKLDKARAESAPDTGEARVAIDKFPVDDAIKTVRGNGARAMYVFSDPSCGYCRRLEPQLAKLNDVTIYTFVVPFLGRELPQAVLCSADPARTWRGVMLQGESAAAPTRADCSSRLDRNMQLARQLGVSGTPTLFYADGGRTSGYADAAEVDYRLSAAMTSANTTARAVYTQEKRQ